MNKTQKEFDRSFCFTFYKSYYEQIMLVKETYGTEKAFEVFQSMAEYGLYQTEITDKEILMLMGTTTVEAIDSSQSRRSNGFAQEDFESTYAIVVYHRDHPEASQRTIAAATGVGKTKVQRILTKIRESVLSIDDYITDVIIPNLNLNDNSNSNNNSIDQDQCDQQDQSQSSSLSTELADAQTVANAPRASLSASTMPTEIDFKCKLSCFTNESLKGILDKKILECLEKDYTKEQLTEYLVNDFNGAFYQCDKEPVRQYITMKLKAD